MRFEAKLARLQLEIHHHQRWPKKDAVMLLSRIEYNNRFFSLIKGERTRPASWPDRKTSA